MPQARRPIRPVRPVRAPSPPKAPRVSPIRLSPVRSEGSVDLDGAVTRRGLPIPPFVRWDIFLRQFRWKTGQHVTVIGPTGSGKTVLNRNLLRHAPLKERRGQFVVVFGIKNRDPELYGPFQREGFQLVRKFDAWPDEDVVEQKVIFAPRSDKQGVEGRNERAKKFKQALLDVMAAGGWTLYVDDLQYQSGAMGLREEFQEVWQIARSEEVELMASSQEPVQIPVMAYGSASYLFLFKNLDDVRAKRMSEFAGVNREVARETIVRLPDHEFLFIDKSSGEMLRSKVIRDNLA